MKTLRINTINSQGEMGGEKTISLQEPKMAVKPTLLAQAVRVFLANQRKAQAKTKTRGMVKGSGAKVWRQKGTGRARHGDRQAPIFVGGGVAHGPTGKENYELKMNQKMRQKAILSILIEKIKEKKFFLVENFQFNKTKEAASFLEKVKETLKADKRIIFLLGKGEESYRFLRNLKEVMVLSTESLNPYFLLQGDLILASQNALQSLEERFGKVKKEE